jgi:hypothetical protein
MTNSATASCSNRLIHRVSCHLKACRYIKHQTRNSIFVTKIITQTFIHVTNPDLSSIIYISDIIKRNFMLWQKKSLQKNQNCICYRWTQTYLQSKENIFFLKYRKWSVMNFKSSPCVTTLASLYTLLFGNFLSGTFLFHHYGCLF